MYSKVKILGHPVHPMLIAYPIAFYTFTLVGYALYILNFGYEWIFVAIAANVAGVVMAIVAAIPGIIDWSIGIPSESPAKRHGGIHMALNVVALVLFLINAIIHVQYWTPTDRPHSGLGAGLALVGVACTVAAGYFGWTMVQDDHVGVNLSPEATRSGR